MKKIVLSIATLLSVNVMVKAQTVVVDFETLTVDSTGYENGKNLGGAPFKTQGLVFENFYSYDTTYGAYWEGWAYSNNVDTATNSYANQYSTIAGKGANNSTQFGIIYKNTQLKFDTSVANPYNFFSSLQITNSTLAVLDMQNGSGFSKKFGGATGNDPDYFYVKFKSTDSSNPDSVVFYLADFRDTNNTNDYIVKTWQTVNLTSLNSINQFGGINISFHSSDAGQFGINTPTYACIDNILLDVTVGNETKRAKQQKFYPNPATTYITTNATTTTIYSVDGVLVKTSNTTTVNIADLANGYYVVKMTNEAGVTTTQKLIKQ